MTDILIAGCGDVGCRAGLRLAADGHRVWGLRRHPGELPRELHPLAADLGDRDSLEQALGSLPAAPTRVAYTAAADAFTADAYHRAYVQGLENLLAVLGELETPPERLVFTSSTGVYGQTDGSWVDEDSATEPARFSGRRVLEGERCCRAGAVPSVSLRLGGIYGPGRDRLIRRVAEREARCEAGPPRYGNRIHSEDAGGALAHLLMLDEPEEIYLGVDCAPVDRCEVLRFLARELGLDAPPTVAAGEGEGSRRSTSNKRCSNRRLLESGYGFLYPTYREGYRPLVRDWLQRAS